MLGLIITKRLPITGKHEHRIRATDSLGSNVTIPYPLDGERIGHEYWTAAQALLKRTGDLPKEFRRFVGINLGNGSCVWVPSGCEYRFCTDCPAEGYKCPSCRPEVK